MGQIELIFYEIQTLTHISYSYMMFARFKSHIRIQLICARMYGVSKLKTHDSFDIIRPSQPGNKKRTTSNVTCESNVLPHNWCSFSRSFSAIIGVSHALPVCFSIISRSLARWQVETPTCLWNYVNLLRILMVLWNIFLSKLESKILKWFRRKLFNCVFEWASRWYNKKTVKTFTLDKSKTNLPFTIKLVHLVEYGQVYEFWVAIRFLLVVLLTFPHQYFVFFSHFHWDFVIVNYLIKKKCAKWLQVSYLKLYCNVLYTLNIISRYKRLSIWKQRREMGKTMNNNQKADGTSGQSVSGISTFICNQLLLLALFWCWSSIFSVIIVYSFCSCSKCLDAKHGDGECVCAREI